MGGTLASLGGIGNALTGIFSSTIFYSSLIRKLFFFRPRLPGEKKPLKIKNISQTDGNKT